mmetsp:Transcript_67687/g.133606  ORF Transcript_67687/g.133606 Transcript_67687/m.133606 type:complete len:100 (+) Transcript_67687:232-531(+)
MNAAAQQSLLEAQSTSGKTKIVLTSKRLTAATWQCNSLDPLPLRLTSVSAAVRNRPFFGTCSNQFRRRLSTLPTVCKCIVRHQACSWQRTDKDPFQDIH